MCPILSSKDYSGEQDSSSPEAEAGGGAVPTERPEPLFKVPYSRAGQLRVGLVGSPPLWQDIRNGFLGGEVIQAICGESGTGKTAIAVDYALRFRAHYRYVFWARASLPEKLVVDFASFSGALGLPEHNSQYLSLAVGSVLTWLASHGEWLLVLDDAIDSVTTRAYATFSDKGHVLITTSASVPVDFARQIKVGRLDSEAARELLHLGGGVSPEEAARVLPDLDGLPVAIAQLAAMNLAGVKAGNGDSQEEEPSAAPAGVPAAVWHTTRRAFSALEQIDPVASDLLRLAAWFHHESIPLELFEEDPPAGEDWGWEDEAGRRRLSAIQNAESYGLLQTLQGEEGISINRLVQVSLRHLQSPEQQRRWLDQAVLAVERVFPDGSQETWSLCDRFLPHAIELDGLINQYAITTPSAALLLGAAAFYLDHRGQAGAAEPLYQRALTIEETRPDADHGLLVTILNNLALIYETQGRYPEAEILLERALAIREAELSPDHPLLHNSLVNLAWLYQAQAKFDEAESLSQRRIEMIEMERGSEHPDLVPALENLAHLYEARLRFDNAESLCERALAIRETAFGADHPETARSIEALANLYHSQNRRLAARLFHERALEIRERSLGSEHSETAASLACLGDLCAAAGNYAEAEANYARALAICLQSLGPVHPRTIRLRFTYDNLLLRTGR